MGGLLKKNFLLFFWIIPLFVFGDGGSIASNRYNDSLIGGTGPAGPAGATGATGPAGPTGPAGTFSSSYGQLYFSTSEAITIESAGTWVAIPFNAFSPSNNVDGSTSSPATITIVESGVYQLNVSLYFSSEDSPESTFTQTTYTLGINTNSGTTTAAAAVYAGEAGFFSLNFTTLVELSETNTIQFYMKASDVGGGGFIFENFVTMINGNANVLQIAE